MEEDRIANLEHRVDELERQLAAMRAPAMSPIPMTPPPVIAPPPPRTHVPYPDYRSRSAAAPATKSAEATEYMIGAQLLPKIGAGLVILAVVFFVAWGYSSGWITPAMVFCAEILFCLAFVGVGQYHRSTKEQFGQLLTGVGSCGLYLTFVGGHLAYHLYSGEILVGLFVLLSFANYAYGLWANSKAFVSIGIIGGLAAAQMPADQGKYGLVLALHLLIAAPAALVAAKKRWMDIALALWLLSMGSSLTAVGEHSIPLTTQVWAILGLGLMPLAAYCKAYVKTAFDPEGAAGPVMAFATALYGFALIHDTGGILPLMVFGAAVAAVGQLGSLKSTMLIAGIAIPTTIAPLCLTATQCAAAYFALSIAGSIVALVSKSKAPTILAICELALSILPFIYAGTTKAMTPNLELGILAEAAVAVVALAFAARPVLTAWDWRAGIATALGGVVVLRAGVLIWPDSNSQLVVALVAATYAAAAATVAGFLRRQPLLIEPWLFFVVSGSAYLAIDFHLASGSAITVISSLLLTYLLASLATARAVKSHSVWHPIALLGWTIMSRWTEIAFNWSGFDVKFLSPATVGWIMFAILLMAVGFLARIRELRYWSFAVMFASVVKILAVDLASTSLPFRVAVLLALGLVMLGGGYIYIKHRQNEEGAGVAVPQ